MKKHILFILLSIFSLGSIHAEITWTLSDDGTLTISGTGDMDDYLYCENHPSHMFYASSAPWFDKRESIKAIVIENGVTSIGNYAFCSCWNLMSVTIPNSVNRIGDYAFASCTMTSIIIPNSVTSIGNSAFVWCNSLSEINIPSTLTTICESTFKNCESLSKISIPKTVMSIGNFAFSGCTRLADVTIEDRTESISLGSYVFEGCSLSSVYIGGKLSYNVSSSPAYSPFYGKKKLQSVVIADTEERIYESEFQGCTNLESVIIGDGVKRIDEWAFADCQKLMSVKIGNGVKSIGEEAFGGCAKIKNITSYAATAPECGSYVWDDVDKLSCVLSIPYGSLASYKNAVQWKEFIFIQEAEPDEQTKIEVVIAKINAIGTVEYTDACKDKIDDATKAYDALTDNQKALVTNLDILINAQQTYETLKTAAEKLAADKAAANKVVNKIKAIGTVEYTDACKNKIDAASKAYEALTDDQKALVSNLDVLTKAKQTYESLKAAAEKLAADKAAANKVVNKIKAIGSVEYTDACKDKIDAANKAYEALTDDQKALVTNLDVLTAAKQTYDNLKAAAEKLTADKAAANKVVNKIKAIGTVEYTDACKSKIDAASKAYEALTDDQKALVTNLNVLTKAKKTYETLKAAAEKLAADKAAAEPVIAKINSIGKVEYTYACKDRIDEANNAYNALTADQKALVTNLDILTTAKQTYDNLKAAADKLAIDKAAADPVIAKIDAIGKVEYTYACKDKIDEANNAYNALTADQKALVTNLDVLTIAKQTYDNLKAAAEKLAADKAAFDKYKAEIIAIIESLLKEDDSDAVKAIINKAISDVNAMEYDVKISLDENKAKINSFVTSVNEAVEKQRTEDQKTNGIEELELAEKANIYDLNGRKITNSMLKSGLYIRNGKKVIVK